MPPFPALGLSSPYTWFLGVLGFMAGARVVELWYAKRLIGKASERGEAPKREPIFIVMVFLHTIPFWAAPLEVWLLKRAFIPVLAWVSLAMLGVAFVMRVWTLSTLGRNWNTRIVKPGSVVTQGPYAFIRHPNYAVVITELLFMPLFGNAWLTCVVVTLLNAFVLAKRIPAEEQVLFEMPGYREAFEKKARFVPGIL